jgi:hypothetical protein
MTITTQPRKPIVYSGSGSAVDNYFSDQPQQEDKPENWGSFTKSNPNPTKRKVLFSMLHQLQWTKPSTKYGEVPDLDRLSKFLQSEKSPVKKPLKDLSEPEMEKLITAFKGILKSTYK